MKSGNRGKLVRAGRKARVIVSIESYIKGLHKELNSPLSTCGHGALGDYRLKGRATPTKAWTHGNMI